MDKIRSVKVKKSQAGGGYWGPTVDVDSGRSYKCKVPTKAKQFTDEWNSKTKLTNKEETTVHRFISDVSTAMTYAFMKAMKQGIDRSQYDRETHVIHHKNGEGLAVNSEIIDNFFPSPIPRLPQLDVLIPEVVRNFTRILNESKLLPSLPTTAQKKVPQKRILRKKVPHHEVVIKKSDFDQYLQGPWHELVGHQNGEHWGNVHGIDLSYEDGAAILNADYSDAVLDAYGSMIAENSNVDDNMIPTVYFPMSSMQILLQSRDVHHPELQPFVETLRRNRENIDVVLAPLHIHYSQHWTLMTANIRQVGLSIFDPIRPGEKIEAGFDTFEDKTESNLYMKRTRDGLVANMRLFRQLLRHALPDQQGWELDEGSDWPMSETYEQIDGISRQGRNRDCGAIVILAMESHSKSVDYDNPELEVMRKQGDWRGVRNIQFLQMRSLSRLGGLGVPLPDLRGKWQPNIYDEEQKKEAEEDCYE
ncbi:uncharacterized protein LOC118437170 [Folsomia candida]|uniref:uncharacterized protein LOC118437170 n=1 Tax=Folsomia candida TaxID=158441 RepID=UPI00160508AC|nr:uncharacterized protein LOC118437170 [Folsomia candida]